MNVLFHVYRILNFLQVFYVVGDFRIDLNVVQMIRCEVAGSNTRCLVDLSIGLDSTV